jgi:hypothetical protein
MPPYHNSFTAPRKNGKEGAQLAFRPAMAEYHVDTDDYSHVDVVWLLSTKSFKMNLPQ